MNKVEIRYGTLTEVATPFGDMTKGDVMKMARLGPLIQVMTGVDSMDLNAINVETVPVAGHIYLAEVRDRTDPDEPEWNQGEMPADIPFGHMVDATAYGTNDTENYQYMQITVELIDPDGLVRDSKTSAKKYCSPAGGPGVTTSMVTLDKYGIWTLYVLLEAEPA